MDNLGIALLDTGKHFTLVSEKLDIGIEYGMFALSLINTDYNEMLSCISDFLQNNHYLNMAMDLQKRKYHDSKVNSAVADQILKPLHKSMAQTLAKEYLNDMQSYMVSLLLIAEIKNKIISTNIDLSDPTIYIPLIYADKTLHEHIKNTLLKKEFAFSDPMQDKINELEFPMSITTTSDGEALPTYYLQDTFSYLILDMQKYLSSSKAINECQCCHRLFYTKYRNSEKYCRLKHKDTPLLCNEIMKRNAKSNSEFAEVRDNARGFQGGRISHPSTQKQYDRNFLRQIYDDWSAECTIKYNEYLSQNDLQGFKDWVEETKFTADRLKQLQKQYQSAAK